MKTKILPLLWIAILAIPALSQVPNSSFEDWTLNLGILAPDGWTISSDEDYPNVLRSNESYNGDYSVELKVVYDPGMEMNTAGFMFTDGNFPVNERFQSLTGYIKGNIIGLDSLKINVSMWLDGEMIGFGLLRSLQSHTNWTQFILDIVYATSDTPNEAFIAMQLGQFIGGNIGSYYLIDKLEFSDETSGSRDPSNQIKVYPNPASDLLYFENLNIKGSATISLINIMGCLVYKRQFGDNQQSGIIDVSGLSEGVYFIQEMRENQVTGYKKLIVKH
ncbi:MAG: T9SS type A sorting domain-containing protein [Bacteroidales bacterium]|nr:T9SS type A sorting domain-containing protein [Bacteroidales bacterium]